MMNVKKTLSILAISSIALVGLTGCGDAINKANNETGAKTLEGVNNMMDQANENNSQNNERITEELDKLSMGE